MTSFQSGAGRLDKRGDAPIVKRAIDSTAGMRVPTTWRGSIVPTVTIVIGVILIVLGIGGYFGTGQQSATALIPAAFGVVLLILGGVATRENARKHAMHAAVIIGLVGFLGTLGGVVKVFHILGGAEVTSTAAGAAYAKTAMSVICLVFVILCVRSFINARRQPAGT
jgi:nitrate/nitrite transporter NarK